MRPVPLAFGLGLLAAVLPPSALAQSTVRDSLPVTRTIQATTSASGDCRYTLVASHPDVQPGGTYDYVGSNLHVGAGDVVVPEGSAGFASWQVESAAGECAQRLVAFRAAVAALGPWYAVYDAEQGPVALFEWDRAGRRAVAVAGGASHVATPDGRRPVAGYAWDFGDGTTATGRTPAAHAYAALGTYAVTLTVTDTRGHSATRTQRVEVADLLVDYTLRVAEEVERGRDLSVALEVRNHGDRAVRARLADGVELVGAGGEASGEVALRGPPSGVMIAPGETGTLRVRYDATASGAVAFRIPDGAVEITEVGTGQPVAAACGAPDPLTGACLGSVLVWERPAWAASSRPDSAASWAERLAPLDMPRVRSSSSPKNRADARGRDEYEFRRLQDPRTGRIPENMRARELAFVGGIVARETLTGRQRSLFGEDWAQRGPLNVGGRTRALAIDLDFNGGSNRRILAGGISGGMFLSEDNGATWRLTSSLAQFASVTALAQDPTNRQVWYHGTGEFLSNSASGVGAPFGREGIFKSVDGGRTWAQLPSTAQGAYTSFDQFFDVVWNVAVHPQTGTVLAATFGGIMRSADGGATWQQVLGRTSSPFSAITDVAIAADGSVYATLSRNGGGFSEFGVYRSTNDGASWTRVSPVALAPDPYRMVLGTAPSDANTVYVFVQKNEPGDDPEDHQLFRYNAASNTWTDRSAGFRDTPNVFGGEFTTQGGYDMLVTVKPDDPNTVWVGGTNLYRSTDGGQAFTWVGGYNADPQNQGQWPNHHPDQHRVVFYPNNPNAMLSGHDGGLSVTTNALQQPQTWTALNNGYLTTQFHAIAIDPQPGNDLLVGGLQDNGSWLTDSRGSGQDWVNVLSGDGGFAAFAPGGFPLYLSVQNGVVIRRTRQGSSRVDPAGEQNYLFITPYLLDPNDAKVMYLAGGNAVWRNSNLDGIAEGNNQPTATNWTRLTGSAVGAPNTHRVTALTVPKLPANRLYFGATNYQSETVLVRVDDPAANPSGTRITPPGLTGGAYPSSIAVHPSNADEIVATFSNYGIESVWHSTNGGTSWTSVEGNLGGADGPSVRWASIVPSAGGTVYLLATSTGVYSTRQLGGTGTSWVQEGASTIGNVVVNMLATRSEDGLVVAGTHGRGAYGATVGQGQGSAVAAVDVRRLDIAAQPGDVGTASFTLRNTGGAGLDFSFTARETDPGRLAVAPKPATVADGALRALGQPRVTLGVGGVVLASMPSGTLVLDDGDETADDFLGFGDGTFVNVSNQFDLTSSFQVERIRFYMRTENYNSNPVGFYVSDGNRVTLEEGTVGLPLSPQGRWYDIALNSPLSFAAGDTFFLDVVMFGQFAFPAGVDVDATVPGKSSFLDPSNGQYVSLINLEGYENGAFLVRAVGTQGGGGTNQPPVANGSISTGQPQVGQTVTFDASASSDPDGQIVSVLWAFGNGATSTQTVATHAYSAAGTYTVTLTVTDNGGATGQASGTVAVTGSTGPSRLTVSPAQGTVAAGGSQTVTVSFDSQGVAEGTYQGVVELTSNGGGLSIPVDVRIDPSVAAEDGPEDSGGVRLAQNYPNPFREGTAIRYELDAPAHVTIEVFDVTGRLIRVLDSGRRAAGSHEVSWDGHNASGQGAASGLYLYRLQAAGASGPPTRLQEMMVLVR